MGSATEETRVREQERNAVPRSFSTSLRDMSSDGGNGAVLWRITQRTLPLRPEDLSYSHVDAESLHPLTEEPMTIDGDHDNDDLPHRHDMPVVKSTSRDTLHGSDSLMKSQSVGVVALAEGELDPLAALAMGLTLEQTSESKGSRESASMKSTATRSASFRQSTEADSTTIKFMWKAHKDRVLAKLSDETFAIKASMLETNDIENEISFSTSAEYQKKADDDASVTTEGLHVIRKTRARLEHLERGLSSSSATSTSGSSSSSRLKSSNGIVEITQKEYVARIKQMEADLVKAWQQNLKVQALRIAIKCVKQLSDTSSAPRLYPCAFVLVSDVLDVFGQLVFDRIKARASEDENGQPLPTSLSDNFTSDEVNIHAKETCRNWFYKTACIRELLPRIYIEIALLKCYRFLCDGEFPQIVMRISNMIKGVGEPMVALYTRLYLALASTELVSKRDKTAVLNSVFDHFFTFRQFEETGKLAHFLDQQNISHNEYLELHSPAIEWLMKCTAQDATDDVFDSLLEQYREYSDNSMVLKHLCESFGATSYARNPAVMLQLMRTATPSQYSKCHLYSVLAIQLSNSRIFGSENKEGKLQFLNEAWSSITAQEDIEMYMECAAAYMKLIVAHYSHREAMILLKDVVRHLNSATPEELTSKVYNMLGALIENVVYGAQQHVDFFTRLIPSGEFLTLMGMFRRESSVSVAKKVLQAFVNTQELKSSKNNLGSFRLHVVGPEAAVAHTLFVICCRVHDALDSLSTASERNDATRDILAFISRLGYAKQSRRSPSTPVAPTDAELQEEEEALLMFYIDCRNSFYKLEPIKDHLTKFAIALAMRVRKRMNQEGRPNSQQINDRRRNFIKSCLAYAHITIPSITEPFLRLDLLVRCTKVSLENCCLPQMEAFLKSAIMAVAELDYVRALSHRELHDTSEAGKNTGIRKHDQEDPVQDVLMDLCTLVLLAPSPVDDEPFYFFDAFRKALFERMTWNTEGSPKRIERMAAFCRARVQIWLVQVCGMWGQSKIPVRLDGVDSNDTLYGGDGSFHQRNEKAFSLSVEQLVQEIESSSFSSSTDEEVASTQATLMTELIVAVYPYISFEESAQSDDSISQDSHAPPKTSSGGAVLLLKCFLFTTDRVKLLSRTTRDLDKQNPALSNIRAKYESAMCALLDYLQQQIKKKSVLFAESARAAIDNLEATLRTLVDKYSNSTHVL